MSEKWNNWKFFFAQKNQFFHNNYTKNIHLKCSVKLTSVISSFTGEFSIFWLIFFLFDFKTISMFQFSSFWFTGYNLVLLVNVFSSRTQSQMWCIFTSHHLKYLNFGIVLMQVKIYSLWRQPSIIFLETILKSTHLKMDYLTSVFIDVMATFGCEPEIYPSVWEHIESDLEGSLNIVH